MELAALWHLIARTTSQANDFSMKIEDFDEILNEELGSPVAEDAVGSQKLPLLSYFLQYLAGA